MNEGKAMAEGMRWGKREVVVAALAFVTGGAVVLGGVSLVTLREEQALTAAALESRYHLLAGAVSELRARQVVVGTSGEAHPYSVGRRSSAGSPRAASMASRWGDT
jgi:hypothetical protein